MSITSEMCKIRWGTYGLRQESVFQKDLTNYKSFQAKSILLTTTNQAPFDREQYQDFITDIPCVYHYQYGRNPACIQILCIIDAVTDSITQRIRIFSPGSVAGSDET